MFNAFREFAHSASVQFELGGLNGGFNGEFTGQSQQSNQGQGRSSGVAPPASKRAIINLPVVQVTSDDLLEETNKECLICLEEQLIGSSACKLPCGHLYHKACLTEWLQKSCTCPVCRYELETDDIAYEGERKGRMLKRKMRFRLDELRAKKVSQLRDVASCLLVSIDGCIDKSEVIERLLASGRIELIEGAPIIVKTRDDFDSMGVGELRRLLLSFGLSDQGALEKNELRNRLLESGRIAIIENYTTTGGSSSSSSNSGNYGSAARSSNTKSLFGYSNHTDDVCRSHDEHNDYKSEGKVNNVEHRKDDDASFRDKEDCNLRKTGHNNDYKAAGLIDDTANVTVDNVEVTDNVAPLNLNIKDPEPSSRRQQLEASEAQKILRDLKTMSISELKKLSSSLSVNLTNCLYKEDIIDRLIASNKFA